MLLFIVLLFLQRDVRLDIGDLTLLQGHIL